MINQKPVTAWYGGSFDPPHKAHEKIVETLVSLPYIDKVIVTPAYLNPFKNSSLSSAELRLEWCRRVFDDPKVSIDALEVESGESVYTYDTLKHLGNEYDIRYIAIGSDNLAKIENWYNFDKLNENFIWLVFDRDGYNNGYEKLREYKRFDIDTPVSSTHIRTHGDLDQVSSKISQEVDKILKRDQMENLQSRIDAIVGILDEKKADEIEVFDLGEADYIAKVVVFANSLGGKHTTALLDHLKDGLKPRGEEFLGTDETEDWVVADLGDIIIHIMTSAYRQKYSIEEFLGELKRGELGS